MQQCYAVRARARRGGRHAHLAAVLRDPAGVYLAGADWPPEDGRSGIARILRRVSSPEARIEGIDARLADPLLRERAGKAGWFVMLLPPAGNLSNPFYAVHPGRNDRFVAAHPPLRRLFPEIDFADFVFTGHLLDVLSGTCAERFAAMGEAMGPIWLERMQQHLTHLPACGVMLHLQRPDRMPMPLDAVRSLCGAGHRLLSVDLVRFDAAVSALAGALTVLRESPKTGA